MAYYAIKTRSGYLYGFYPNGLPTGSKLEYVESKNKVLPVLRLSEVILQSGGKKIFNKEQEAMDYICYIKRELSDKENVLRYENARPGSSIELLKLVDTFKIVRIA